jgi:hypothetical protein
MTDSAPIHPIHPDDLAELALGVEDPDRHPFLLAHLARCGTCCDDLAVLVELSDRLAALAPAAEPGAGFEQRVLERLAGTQEASAGARAGRRGRPRWVRPALVAAVVAAAAALAVVLPLSLPSAGSHRDRVEQATLTSARGPAGDVLVDTGSAPWLSMWVQGWAGQTLTCQMVTPAGRVITLGSFRPGAEGGFWGRPVPAAARQATTVRLVDRTGRVVATAHLR